MRCERVAPNPFTFPLQTSLNEVKGLWIDSARSLALKRRKLRGSPSPAAFGNGARDKCNSKEYPRSARRTIKEAAKWEEFKAGHPWVLSKHSAHLEEEYFLAYGDRELSRTGGHIVTG